MREFANDDHIMWFRVSNTYLHPFKENVVRFDFEVDAEDESMCGVLPIGGKQDLLE
jgi:hypothetical protein